MHIYPWIFCLALCTSFANADNRNRQRLKSESSDYEEESDSLFGTTEDPEIDMTAATTTTTPTSSGLKNPRKDSSRKIQLPKDYNKLQVPNMRSLNLEVALKNIQKDFPDAYSSLDANATDADKGEIFMKKYGDTPLSIVVDVKVRNVRSIDEINEEITVEMDFIAHWLDYVLFYEHEDDVDAFNILSENITHGLKSLDPSFLNKIWKPDVFIEKVISISRPELITKPFRLLYSPSGYIIFSTRVTVRMNCQMEFYYYPADTQSCIFRIRSYSYTTKDVDIDWDDPGPTLLDRNEHNFHVKMDKMKSLNFVESEGLLDSNYSETYRILQFKISGRRKMSYHLIQTYLPSSFFIVITWMSFLIPASMVEARIGISMTTLLTLTSMFASVREDAPMVSYVKAIDIWMVVCIFFVFLTLFEFTILTWRRHLTANTVTIDSEESTETQLKNDDTVIEKLDLVSTSTGGDDPGVETSLQIPAEQFFKLFRKRNVQAEPWINAFIKGIPEKDIENYGFRTFSILFILFNCVYWPWLMLASGYYEWNVDKTYNI